ncbi:MAG: hypothetical protein DCC65_05415 [Planctomycetota bacterium]|nr:MAG: hypothetical protein DCC65_05415 [Planctomycetota bacterium]
MQLRPANAAICGLTLICICAVAGLPVSAGEPVAADQLQMIEVSGDAGTTPRGGGAVCPLGDGPCTPFQASQCVSPTGSGQCRVVSAIYDPTQPNLVRVSSCSCVLQGHCGNLTLQGDIIRCDGDCPVPPTGNQCQVLVNGVPSGSSFVIFTTYPPGTQFSCGCNTSNPPCEPAPGGQGCNQTQCPNSGEVCFPRCVTMTATGPVVVDCECRQDIECHIEMGPALPYCNGLCPPGTECVRSETVNTDGTITYCCDCVPITTCEPLPDQSACAPVQCPIAGEECQPRCILIGFDGVPRVTDCECGSPNECHAELLPGAQIPECIGGCPPGQVCIQRVFATPEGTRYCCECVQDPPECIPTPDRTACVPFQCPQNGALEECQPRCVRMTNHGTIEVINCDCRGLAECHVVWQPGITPYCEGACPPGQTCVQSLIQNPDGSFDICCDCIEDTCRCRGDVNGDGVINGLDINPFVRCFLGIPIPGDHCECADIDEDGQYTAFDISLFIQRILGKYRCDETPCCPKQDLVEDLRTGVNDDNTLIPVGNDDPDWTVFLDASGGSTPRPATVVAAHPSWQTFPGTQWVSANYFGPNGEYGYEFCFCLDERYSNPVLTLQLRGDDDSQVFLNGNFIGNGAGFNVAVVPPITVNNPAFFQPGTNCVRVLVQNIGGAPTGFNMNGTMTADDGVCCCDPADLDKPIGSGVYDNSNVLIPGGNDDDTWTVTVDPSGGITPRPATVLDATMIHPLWLTIPGTQWISANYNGPNGVYHYEYCFCLDPRFEDPVLDLYLRADDFAEVFLNGVLVGQTPNGWAFNTPQPTHVFITDPDLFLACENCIEIRVHNTGGPPTGLNVAGSVRARNGLCCDDRQYSCCLPDGNCQDLAPGVMECEFGTLMIGPCQSYTACCMPDGSCQFLEPRCCELAGGSVLPPGVTCSTGAPQACCIDVAGGGSMCIDAEPTCCQFAYNGVPQGPGTFCQGDLDGNGVDEACEPPPPPCGLNPATGQCYQTQCPIAGQECRPRCVLVEAATQQVIQIVDCACTNLNTCHLELSPAPSTPFCQGGCPPGFSCFRNVVDHGNGTQTVCCGCTIPNP